MNLMKRSRTGGFFAQAAKWLEVGDFRQFWPPFLREFGDETERSNACAWAQTQIGHKWTVHLDGSGLKAAVRVADVSRWVDDSGGDKAKFIHMPQEIQSAMFSIAVDVADVRYDGKQKIHEIVIQS